MSAGAQGTLRSFSSSDRFLAEVRAASASQAGARVPMRAGYVFLGDEVFLYERCRRAAIDGLVEPALRGLSLSEVDLASTGIFEALDRARTPSLLAPFQIIFVRGLKILYSRGGRKEEFAAIREYFRSPNPQALLIFVADHLTIPADIRRMEMQDKERYERIRDTLGEDCGMVELCRVEESDAARWLVVAAQSRGAQFEPDAARELVDALGGNMMAIASELEKLTLYAAASGRIGLGDVEAMVVAARQRSLYELTDAISAKDKARALALLHGMLNASGGGENSAIGHLFLLARTFRQMLVVLEKNVRDSRAIWQALWPGFRPPPFAADDLIRQARRYKSRRDLLRAIGLVARADWELRSSPPDKRLVLERLVLALAGETGAARPSEPEGLWVENGA